MTTPVTTSPAGTARALAPAFRRRRRPPLWLAALAWAVLSTALYAAAGAVAAGEAALPLDDAWIHQTLARSLAATGTLAVNPGEPVAASTSPLWTAVLALGYVTGAPLWFWAWAAGALCFAAAILATSALGRALFPERAEVALLAAFFVALDWHLAWAAASGMETALFVALSLVLLRLGAVADTPLPLLGAVGGLAALTRPEGSVLFVGALAARLLRATSRRQWLVGAAGAAAAFGVLLLPVVAYHLAVFGSPLPATFFAKGAYYREPLSLDLLLRYSASLLGTLLAGPLLVLLPGLLALTRCGLGKFRQRAAGHLLAAGWLVGLPLMYLLWLPWLYHHGRYVFPVIPLALLYGVAGALAIWQAASHRLLVRSMGWLAVAVAGATWLAGAGIFAADARIITGQHVQAARWLAAATPPGAVVATHDIGAAGYFSGRQIIDMAGLITPALTASPRDRQRIIETLRQERVTYVAVLWDWYPWFPGDLPAHEVFRTSHWQPGHTEDRGFRVYQLAPSAGQLP